jgi:ankyrin repeat protein
MKSLVLISFILTAFSLQALLVAQDNSIADIIIEAAKNGDIGTIKQQLYRRVASDIINIQNKEGRTALMEAAKGGHLNVVKLLVGEGATINAVDVNGSTALIEAAKNGSSQNYQEIVRLLISHGANTALRDKIGNTALNYAKSKGFTSLITILEGAQKQREK